MAVLSVVDLTGWFSAVLVRAVLVPDPEPLDPSPSPSSVRASIQFSQFSSWTPIRFSSGPGLDLKNVLQIGYEIIIKRGTEADSHSFTHEERRKVPKPWTMLLV